MAIDFNHKSRPAQNPAASSHHSGRVGNCLRRLRNPRCRRYCCSFLGLTLQLHKRILVTIYLLSSFSETHCTNLKHSRRLRHWNEACPSSTPGVWDIGMKPVLQAQGRQLGSKCINWILSNLSKETLSLQEIKINATSRTLLSNLVYLEMVGSLWGEWYLKLHFLAKPCRGTSGYTCLIPLPWDVSRRGLGILAQMTLSPWKILLLFLQSLTFLPAGRTRTPDNTSLSEGEAILLQIQILGAPFPG